MKLLIIDISVIIIVEKKWKTDYPNLRRTLLRALSSSLNAKAVEERIDFLTDLILADNSSLS